MACNSPQLVHIMAMLRRARSYGQLLPDCSETSVPTLVRLDWSAIQAELHTARTNLAAQLPQVFLVSCVVTQLIAGQPCHFLPAEYHAACSGQLLGEITHRHTISRCVATHTPLSWRIHGTRANRDLLLPLLLPLQELFCCCCWGTTVTAFSARGTACTHL